MKLNESNASICSENVLVLNFYFKRENSFFSDCFITGATIDDDREQAKRMPGQPAKTHLTGAALGLRAVNRRQVKRKQTNELFLGEAFNRDRQFLIQGS